ncbi:hypothetical protein EXIGLDRAFT_306376 [Exidia glandulosa HHB12029]|uniref:Uncharacterized protein n=1 Tax=Exidia glandulosa HHB12029 TaxID=1314781 RepID=A0A165D3F8_EXIGL|nr:hypothetical protein EXIGLDRAFT_306376 [Exidia glandulosa HHB12029]
MRKENRRLAEATPRRRQWLVSGALVPRTAVLVVLHAEQPGRVMRISAQKADARSDGLWAQVRGSMTSNRLNCEKMRGLNNLVQPPLWRWVDAYCAEYRCQNGNDTPRGDKTSRTGAPSEGERPLGLARATRLPGPRVRVAAHRQCRARERR